jgi:guanylate kinase
MTSPSNQNASPGQLVVISGPSGVGKSTVVRQLLAKCPLPLTLSVSATTRAPRPNEREGVDYRFVSHEQFEEYRNTNQFLECAEVFGRGDWYGTLKQPVDELIALGKWVVLEIDVDGAMQVLKQVPECLTVFIHPGSMAELEKRLRGRKTESEEKIQRRLQVAERELRYSHKYQQVVINNEVYQAVDQICNYLQQNRRQ